MVAKGLLLVVAGASAGRVWHLTDIHVDPVYQVNASTKAYCNGAVVADPALQAPVFGAPVGDCATPQRLYDSALGFMASHISSKQRFEFLCYCLQSVKEQHEPLDMFYISWSASPDFIGPVEAQFRNLESAAKIRTLFQQTPHSQYEHLQQAARAAKRDGVASTAWCMFSDDDDPPEAPYARRVEYAAIDRWTAAAPS